jgi:hypothetical protein
MLRTKELIVIGLMGALMFVASFVLGSALNVATGIPFASGITSMIIQPIALTIAVLLIRKFWVGTYMYLVYAILAIPTNMLGGVPGVWKIAVALPLGLVFDICMYLTKYKKFGLYISFIVMNLLLMPGYLAVYYLLNLPGYAQLIKIVPVSIVVFIIISMISIVVGLAIFKRLEKKKAIINLISQ